MQFSMPYHTIPIAIVIKTDEQKNHWNDNNVKGNEHYHRFRCSRIWFDENVITNRHQMTQALISNDE